MSEKNIVNEVENTIIFCIAIALLSFFFYYLLDFEDNKSAGLSTNVFLFLRRIGWFLLGGTVAATIKYFKTKEWDFKLFFWLNVALVVVGIIVDINLKI